MAIIIINGKEQEMEAPVILTDLIKKSNVEQPDMVSVQINGEFVAREDFSTRQVNGGDEVDFLYFMGGGC